MEERKKRNSWTFRELLQITRETTEKATNMSTVNTTNPILLQRIRELKEKYKELQQKEAKSQPQTKSQLQVKPSKPSKEQKELESGLDEHSYLFAPALKTWILEQDPGQETDPDVETYEQFLLQEKKLKRAKK